MMDDDAYNRELSYPGPICGGGVLGADVVGGRRVEKLVGLVRHAGVLLAPGHGWLHRSCGIRYYHMICISLSVN